MDPAATGEGTVSRTPPPGEDAGRLRRAAPSRDPVSEYYGTLAPWLDRALADRGDLGWWKRLVDRLDPRSVVELGSGTGRVTGVLAAPGRTVVGLDRVAALLRRARSRLRGVPGVHLVRGDLRSPPLRRGWDLVAAPNDPLIHVEGDRDRQQALDASAGLLAPAGRLVVELLWWTPGEVEEARSPSGLRRTREATTAEGGTLVVGERWRLAPDGRTVSAEYRYLPPHGRPATASFRGRRWTLAELRRRSADAGLEIVRTWGDFDDRPFDPEDARALIVEARRSGAGGGGASLP